MNMLQCHLHPRDFSDKSRPLHSCYFMGLQRKKEASTNEGEQFDIRMTVDEFKGAVGMYTLWKSGMEIHVTHVKRRNLPNFVFPGGVHPSRPTRVVRVSGHAVKARAFSQAEDHTLPQLADVMQENGVLNSNLPGTKCVAGDGPSYEPVHESGVLSLQFSFSMPRQAHLPPRCPYRKKTDDHPLYGTVSPKMHRGIALNQTFIKEEQPTWINDLLDDDSESKSSSVLQRVSATDSLKLSVDLTSIKDTSGSKYGPNSPHGIGKPTFQGNDIALVLSEYVRYKNTQNENESFSVSKVGAFELGMRRIREVQTVRWGCQV